MLLLSRKVGENIVIDTPQGQVVVTVCRIKRGVVRIGSSAPRNIPIYLAELHPPVLPEEDLLL